MKTPTIKLTPVKSSQVESIGFADGTLAVKFSRGGLYHYHGVSAEQFAALQKAESVGSHIHTHFVKTKHKFSKIDHPAHVDRKTPG